MPHVTVPDADPDVTLSVTTATTGPFTIPFVFTEKSDVKITVGGVLLTDEQWTLGGTKIGGGYQTGTVTLANAASNTTVRIWRDLSVKRTTDFASGPLPKDSLNDALDRLTMQVQDLSVELKRTVRVRFGDTLADMGLKSIWANSVIGFDANFNLVPYSSAAGAGGGGGVSVSAAMIPVVQAATLAAARTAFGITATGESLFTASNVAAARTALGATAFGVSIFTAADAAAGRTALGATAVGSALFTATDAAAARAAIGASTGGGGSTLWSDIVGTGKPADNSTRNVVSYGITAPASPADGDLWVDTSTAPYRLKIRLFGAWYEASTRNVGLLADLNFVNTGQILDGAIRNTANVSVASKIGAISSSVNAYVDLVSATITHTGKPALLIGSCKLFTRTTQRTTIHLVIYQQGVEIYRTLVGTTEIRSFAGTTLPYDFSGTAIIQYAQVPAAGTPIYSLALEYATGGAVEAYYETDNRTFYIQEMKA